MKSQSSADLEPLGGSWWIGRNRSPYQVELPFLVRVPETALPSSRLPLLIALHGAVDRSRPPTAEGIPKLEDRFSAWLDDSVLLFPGTCESAPWWHPIGANHVLESLRRTLAVFPVDPDRVMGLGNSAGGAGICYLAANHATPFSGFVCLHCWPPHAELARIPWFRRNLATKPFFVAHGKDDTLYPASLVREEIDQWRKVCGVSVDYRESTGVGHSLEPAWQELVPEIRNFFLSTRRQCFPRTLDWETEVPERGLCHWMRIDGIGPKMLRGRASAMRRGNRVICETWNVARLAVLVGPGLAEDGNEALEIVIDGHPRWRGHLSSIPGDEGTLANEHDVSPDGRWLEFDVDPQNRLPTPMH